MKVEKDDRVWCVSAIMPNRKCPYLFYPINIYGCRHPSQDNKDEWQKCTLENCPIRTGDETTELLTKPEGEKSDD